MTKQSFSLQKKDINFQPQLQSEKKIRLDNEISVGKNKSGIN